MSIKKSMPLNYTRENPFLASIKHRALLNKPESSKRTYHLELDLKKNDLEIYPGDSVAILPQNNPEYVEKILAYCQKDPSTEVFDKRKNKKVSVGDFLTNRANLNKVTSRLLKKIHEKAPSSKWEHLFHPDHKKELSEYLHSHEIIDLIPFCKDAKLDIQELCDLLLPQMPRFYSIASSLKMHPDEIHLTVAKLTYPIQKEMRCGVASYFLCHIANENTPIPLYVHPSNGFTLPIDPDANIIMVGPGTGIAPFRAFLQERQQEKAKGKNWLFFGERQHNYDFYYKDFFEGLVRTNFLRLDTAFSRDQKEKIYVQHRLLEKGAEIYDWLQKGSYFYVCGDAKQMAKSVDLALREIFVQHGHLTEEQSLHLVKNLKKEKKYLLDVY